MIGIEELEKRLEKMLDIFKIRTRVLGCLIIDEDGFILKSIKESILEIEKFELKIIQVFSKIEELTKIYPKDVNYHDQNLVVTYGEKDDYSKKGLLIILRAINNNLNLMVITPLTYVLKPLFDEINIFINELSVFFLNSENEKFVNHLYKLV